MSSSPDAIEDVKLSVLLPVRNEGISLAIMLRILQAALIVPYEVLVVYDSTEDNSIETVESMAEVNPRIRGVLNRQGRGVINAIKSGVQAARGDYVLIFAADEVGPVVAIDDMLALLEEGCDFVSSSRYSHGGRRLGGSMVGGLLSRTANFLFHRVAGCALSDATTGIKMFRRDCFQQMNLEARPIGWAVAFEMSMKAQGIGLTLGEVPILSVDRLYGGESTFRLGPWCIEYLRWFVWGIKHLRGKPVQPVRVRIPMSTPTPPLPPFSLQQFRQEEV